MKNQKLKKVFLIDKKGNILGQCQGDEKHVFFNTIEYCMNFAVYSTATGQWKQNHLCLQQYGPPK